MTVQNHSRQGAWLKNRIRKLCLHKGKKVQESLKFKRHGIKWGMKTQFFFFFIYLFVHSLYILIVPPTPSSPSSSTLTFSSPHYPLPSLRRRGAPSLGTISPWGEHTILLWENWEHLGHWGVSAGKGTFSQERQPKCVIPRTQIIGRREKNCKLSSDLHRRALAHLSSTT